MIRWRSLFPTANIVNTSLCKNQKSMRALPTDHTPDRPGRRLAAGGGHGWKILNARSYYNGMKRKLIKTHKERWEQGLAALSKFRKRKRHCCPSRHHLEGRFKLGRWVNTQRFICRTQETPRQDRVCLELARVSLGARLCSPFEVQTP